MARPGKVPFWVKFSFGFGQIAEYAFMVVIGAFAAVYYNQGLRLENDLVGWAIGLAIFFDAVSDPAVGALSDRWKSKWGRRHPFLFVAPVPLALCLYFLFSPPESLTAVREGAELPAQIPLFLWMAVWHILARFFLTLYVVPHLALGAELSSDYNERASVFSFNAMFGHGFQSIFTFAAWWMLAGTSTRAYDGEIVPRHLDAANYLPVILLACGSVILGIWICAIGTRKEIPHLAQPSKDVSRFSPAAVVKDMYQACQTRNYRVLLIAVFFLLFTIGMVIQLGSYISTFFFEMEGTQLKWFGLAAMVGYVTGAWVVPFWIKRFGKRRVCIGNMTAYFIILPAPVLDRLTGLNLITPANGTPQLLWFLLVHVALMGHCGSGFNVAVMSMLADVIDEHTLKTGHVQTGILYSARTFFSKTSQSAAQLIGGLALRFLVRMPIGAVPGRVGQDVLMRLGWTWVFGSLGVLISIFFYFQYRLSKEDHARIRAELESRQRASPAHNVE
jgi:Na+/melibiose symporter-like transporter